MKSKITGLIILIAVSAVVGEYFYVSSNRQETKTLSGYLGGEKVGLIEDEEIEKYIEDTYHVKFDYSKAGSLEMITADQSGRDYLFPSSQVALELYKSEYGSPKKSEIIFNTPIVFYTHRAVTDAFEKEGLIRDLGDGAKGVDMDRFTQMIVDGKKWQDIGLTQLYGAVSVSTTDPEKSNSGNMFAGLLADVMTGSVADRKNIGSVMPELQTIFERSGYMVNSSGDLFSQFLRMGIGAMPIMAGYESQLLEFTVQNPDTWAKVKDDIDILYPVPTVWSSHPYIALTDDGARGIDALLDDKVQDLAWTKHGFRTGVSGADADTAAFDVNGLQKVVGSVVQMPDSGTMQEIIDHLS